MPGPPRSVCVLALGWKSAKTRTTIVESAGGRRTRMAEPNEEGAQDQATDADNEVLITTNQFNYQGRNGSRSAEIYIAGPYAVAAAAVAGRIVDPRGLLAA